MIISFKMTIYYSEQKKELRFLGIKVNLFKLTVVLELYSRFLSIDYSYFAMNICENKEYA